MAGQNSKLGFQLGSPLGGSTAPSGALTVLVSDSLSLSDSVSTQIIVTQIGVSDTLVLSDSTFVDLIGTSVTYSIIIDHTQVCATLTNYPLRFGVTDGSNPWLATVINGGSVQSANGYDITFTSDFAGVDELPFERVYWDPVTGNSKFYVLVPSVSSTLDTVIFAHAGAPIFVDKQNPPAVWTPAGYQLVQHFPNGSVLSVADSTQQNTITNHGATANAGYDTLGAAAFNGTSQYIDDGTAAQISLSASDGTLEAWVNIPSGAGSNHAIVAKVDASAQNGYELFINASDSRQQVALAVWSSGTESSNASDSHASIGAGWLYCVGKWQHGVNQSGILWVNGVQRGTDGNSGAYNIGNATGVPLTIGFDQNNYFPGDIGEVRVANVAQSDCWIKAVWANLKSASTFYSTNNIPTGAVISQFSLETSYLPNPGAVVSQYVMEVGYIQRVYGQVSQYVIEVAYLYPPVGKWQLTEA